MKFFSCNCGFLRFFRREIAAFLCGITLWVFIVVSVTTPWYSIGGSSISLPWYDTAAGVFWWNGLNLVYSPPLPPNNTREITLGWDQMPSAYPKNIYFSSVAMGILGLGTTSILEVLILFGLVCSPTGRLLNLMACGFFKYILTLVAFFNVILLILSWAIFLAFNEGLYHADLCLGSRYFPAGRNMTDDSKIGINYGQWCCGFEGHRQMGTGQWLWAPSIGWVFAVINSAFAFIIFLILMTVDNKRYQKSAAKKAEKRLKEAIKARSSKRRKFEEEEDEWEMSKRKTSRKKKEEDANEDPREREPLTRAPKGRRARPPPEDDEEEIISPRGRKAAAAGGRQAGGARRGRRQPVEEQEVEEDDQEEVLYPPASRGRRSRK